MRPNLVRKSYRATADGDTGPAKWHGYVGGLCPTLDQQKRPITAGGFVDSGPVIFQDIAKKAGLTTWRHVMGTPQKAFILETVGSGVALLDYDNDGWLDIYLVNGSTVRCHVRKDFATACRAFS